MTRGDSLSGAIIVIYSVIALISFLLDIIMYHSDWWLVVLLILNGTACCYVLASVWRDRL